MPKPTSLLKGFEKVVATVEPKAKRQVIFDPETTGLAFIVTPKGKRSFSIVARDPVGRQVWKQIGTLDELSVSKARERAVQAVARVKAGETELFPHLVPELAPETFKQVSDRFIQRWVDKGGRKQDGTALRSKREIERQLGAYIYPRWGSKPFLSIRRGAVTELMDGLVDNNGPVQADRVLSTLAKMFNWYRQYDERYVSPIIPEMKRSGSSAARARTRVLSDEEIRALWVACGEVGVFGAFAKVALLTGQRRAKVATMRWSDISGNVWTIPAEAREKVNACELTLPELALEVIEARPTIADNPFVFAARGKKAFNSFSDGKEDLNGRAPIDPWVIHDLRRTARSLMARAGVRSDVAERTLGHVIKGVEGIYDRHDYREEKAQALAALAGLVETILRNESPVVVPAASESARRVQ